MIANVAKIIITCAAADEPLRAGEEAKKNKFTVVIQNKTSNVQSNNTHSFKS